MDAARRVVSRWEILALSLNDVVGSGVYLLPAAAAALGPASPFAVLFAGVAVSLVVLCFAEAASRFDAPGGAFLYARAAFGDFAGFEVGWMTFLTRVATLASLSAGFAQALSWIWPAAGSGVPRLLAVSVPVVFLVSVNVAGVKAGARTAASLLVLKLSPLVVLLVLGAPRVRAELLLAPSPVEARLGEVALLLLFAYAGFENTPAAAGEFQKPERNVPFALLSQIALVTLLYVSVQVVTQGTLPGVTASKTPLADASRLLMGAGGGVLLSVGALASILGTMGTTVFSAPRYLYALARDGYGPAFLGKDHPRFGTPAAAIVALAALALPLAWTGSFLGLAALSVVARLTTYVATAAAIPVLRKKRPADGAARRLPGGAAIPAGAIAVCLFLLASAGWRDVLAGAAAVAAGVVVYALRRPRR